MRSVQCLPCVQGAAGPAHVRATQKNRSDLPKAKPCAWRMASTARKRAATPVSCRGTARDTLEGGACGCLLECSLHDQALKHKRNCYDSYSAHMHIQSSRKCPHIALRCEAVTSSTSRAAASMTSSPVFTRPVGIFHTPCAPAAP